MSNCNVCSDVKIGETARWPKADFECCVTNYLQEPVMTYVRDIVLDGKLYHELALQEGGTRCRVCGARVDAIHTPCQSGGLDLAIELFKGSVCTS